ncbi:tpaE [Nocardiopsis alba]|uniref:tpaE n=1 Tax=Nocardiopsis alba TaxID=53437 RepID=UPI00366AE1D0
MSKEVRAETVGRAARGGDLQLTVPLQPSVRRGVRFRGVGDAVVLDGSDQPQAFNGAFARETLIPLTDLCDGTRGHRELANRLGLEQETVYKALALLWAAGGVEESPGETGRPVSPELSTLLSRLGNSTGANRSWTECVDRLGHRTVRLEGHGPSVAAAGRAFGEVCTVVEGPPGDGRSAVEGELAVFFETGATRLVLGESADRCWREGVPLLRVRVGSGAVTLGPYVDPALTPCVECGTCDETDHGGEPSEHVVELAAGVTAHHVMALFTRATMTHLPLDASRIEVTDLSTSYTSAVSRPGCRTCSHSKGPIADTVPDSAVYEASVAMPPRAFLDPKGHLGHYQTGNIRITAEFRSWPSSPKVDLPEPDLSRLVGRPEAPGHDRTVTLEDLSLVLKVAFGVRELPTAEGERVRRWTAAAGNIGCTTAYVLCRDDSVLPAGVYAYVERDHVLARLPGEIPPGEDQIELVIVGDLAKVMRKYGTFGLRLTMLDAGCELTSARDVAEALGLFVRPVADWDDGDLARALGTSRNTEPVVAAAVLEAPREI